MPLPVWKPLKLDVIPRGYEVDIDENRPDYGLITPPWPRSAQSWGCMKDGTAKFATARTVPKKLKHAIRAYCAKLKR